jgi:ATP-dependent Clp protease ATP-binding subunit ClpC
MTSNIGSDAIQEHNVLGFRGGIDQKTTDDKIKQTVMDALKANFRPEFLNRVDEIIVFNSLSEDHIKKIVDIQIALLKKRLADRHLDIELTDAAKNVLAKDGYDPVYGARPLKRAIQREIQDKLAMELLEGKFKEGDRITVDANDKGEIVFEHATDKL